MSRVKANFSQTTNPRQRLHCCPIWPFATRSGRNIAPTRRDGSTFGCNNQLNTVSKHKQIYIQLLDDISVDEVEFSQSFWLQRFTYPPNMLQEYIVAWQPDLTSIEYDKLSDVDICTHEEGFNIIDNFFPSCPSPDEGEIAPTQDVYV